MRVIDARPVTNLALDGGERHQRLEIAGLQLQRLAVGRGCTVLFTQRVQRGRQVAVKARLGRLDLDGEPGGGETSPRLGPSVGAREKAIVACREPWIERDRLVERVEGLAQPELPVAHVAEVQVKLGIPGLLRDRVPKRVYDAVDVALVRRFDGSDLESWRRAPAGGGQRTRLPPVGYGPALHPNLRGRSRGLPGGARPRGAGANRRTASG